MLTLTPPELRELTGYKPTAKQRAVLDELGIPWRDVRGRTIVLRVHVESWAEGRTITPSAEPRMDLVQ